MKQKESLFLIVLQDGAFGGTQEGQIDEWKAQQVLEPICSMSPIPLRPLEFLYTMNKSNGIRQASDYG